MKKSIKTKVLAVIASMSMVFSLFMLPINVSATGNEASVNGVEYATLKEALEIGGEVSLLRDVEINETIEVKKDIILNLGSFSIINNVKKARPLSVKASNLTIKANDNGGMIIPSTNTDAYGFVEASVENLTILGGRYTGDTDNGCLFKMALPISKTSTIKVDNIVADTSGQIISTKDTFDSISGFIINSKFHSDTCALYFDVLDTSEKSILNINNVNAIVERGPVLEVAGGNTVLSNNSWEVTGNYNGGYTWARSAIGVGYEGRLTINGGYYSASTKEMGENEGYGIYIYTSGGHVTINDGVFEGATASLRADVDLDSYKNATSTIIVNDGHFYGDILTTKHGKEKILLKGGIYEGISNLKPERKTGLSIEGGQFRDDVMHFVVDTQSVAKVDDFYQVGTKEYVQKQIILATNTVVALQNLDDFKAPQGIVVKNNTGSKLIVNGDILEVNGSMISNPAPEADVYYSNEDEWINKDVTVELYVSEPIRDLAGWEKLTDDRYKKVYRDNEVEEVELIDLSGKKTIVKINVQNIDKQAPEIRGIKDVTLTVGDKFELMKDIFAYDNQCGNIDIVNVKGSVDVHKPGVYVLEYSATDMAGNTVVVKRNVTVQKKNIPIVNSVPTINAKDITLTVGDKFDALKGVTATDKEDGNLTRNIKVIKNTVNTNKVGEYEVTYEVSDSKGEKVVKTIKVIVKTASANSKVPTDDNHHTMMYVTMGALVLVSALVVLNKKREDLKS